MALAAPKPCSYPGCRLMALAGTPRCDRHPAEREREQRRQRIGKELYTWKWQKASRGFLMAHPMCDCAACNGMKLVATVVDHVVPHRGDRELFWDRSNWLAMNKHCHDRKTAREDGGFGNAQGGVGQKSRAFQS